MTEQRTIHPGEDPVCAMPVDPADAGSKDLTVTHHDIEYSFCGSDCLVDFRADPAWFLDTAYAPKVRSTLSPREASLPEDPKGDRHG